MSKDKEVEVKWLDDDCEIPPYGLAFKDQNITLPSDLADTMIRSKKAKLVNITVKPMKEEK